ncbi:MAG: hypothetical protein PHX87_05695 [Candidatus Peribacteraceae bacterium]|nr:hypothetical protein [Candidatus Peribacteraceae bacterium]MDD5742885.1 hypothetical protein [Candidatus Peribacteraceae bacterium]
MGTRDDEDVWASYSRQERFTRADPRKDALKREVESQQGKNILDKDAKRLKELKTKVNLQELQSKVAGKEDEEVKRTKRDEEEKKPKTFHTETIKEKEEAAVDTAKTKPTSERLIKKEEAKREEQAQAGQEYQQQAG